MSARPDAAGSETSPAADEAAAGEPRPPVTLEAMRRRLTAELATLSPRLRDVGDYLENHPQSIATDTLAEIATRAGSHPSTLVRFANHFGFNGFSELQRLYKRHVQEHFEHYGSDYGARIRRLQRALGDDDDVDPPRLLAEFTEANLLSLEAMRDDIDPERLIAAVDLMERAGTVHVCGIRRAFPVAMYVHYALTHIGVDCRAVDGLGLMHEHQAMRIGEGDLLIAITFSPWADEVRRVVRQAHENGAAVVLLTDRDDAPSTALADIVFAVRDAEVRSFRSLNASLCLAQSLCIALGYRREIPNDHQDTPT